MQLVALTNFHIGLREAAEIIPRGATFTTRGTGIMNASEVGQILIRDGNACLPENAEKCLSKSQAAWDWARAEVALLDAMRATGRERPDSPRPGATPHESR